MSPLERRLRDRAIALAVGALIAAGAGVAYWRLRPARIAGPVLDNTLDVEALRISRRLEPRGLSLPEGAPREEPVRRKLSQEEVLRGMGLQRFDNMSYDPLRLFRFHPGLRVVVPWPEHPNGRWTRVTNNEGAREVRDLALPLPRPFVLAAGDSHTEGMCDNSENWCSLLERALAERTPGRAVEVYDTGTSGYCLASHLGVLEEFAERDPDVFVTAIFGGNDFLELLRVEHLSTGTEPPPRPRDFWRRVHELGAITPAALPQGLSQLLFFREHPDELELALRASEQVSTAMQRICEARGIHWLALYVPSVFSVRPRDWEKTLARLDEVLHLGRADLELEDRLADRLLASLAQRGIAVLDLRPVFAAEGEPLYWQDMHINLRGQAVVARALLPRIEELLARPR